LTLYYYLRGASLSAQGLLLQHEGSAIAGLRKLMKSRGDFERCIRSDPDFFDAYLGRGAYRYGVATHASIAGWLPFIPDKREGWEDMWLAVEKSSFSKWSALSALVWFVMEDEQYGLADSICTAALERFPTSRTFLGARLSLERKRQNWPVAYEIAQKLEQEFAALDSTNGHELIGLRHNLMQLADELGYSNEAITWARTGVATPRTAEVSEQRKQKLHDFELRLKADGP
jgi:hypothetical protein